MSVKDATKCVESHPEYRETLRVSCYITGERQSPIECRELSSDTDNLQTCLGGECASRWRTCEQCEEGEQTAVICTETSLCFDHSDITEEPKEEVLELKPER